MDSNGIICHWASPPPADVWSIRNVIRIPANDDDDDDDDSDDDDDDVDGADDDDDQEEEKDWRAFAAESESGF